MTQSLSIDVDELMALTPELDEIASYAAAALERLRLTLTNAGAYWGTGQTGREFAATFEPDSQQALRYMEELVSSLKSQAEYVRSTVSQIQAQDQLNAHQVAAQVENGTSAGQSVTGETSQQAASTPTGLASTSSPASAGVALSPAATTANAGTPSSAGSGVSSPQSQSQSPSGSGGSGGSAGSSGSAGQQPDGSGSAQSVPGDQPTAPDEGARRQATSRGGASADAASEEADDSPWAAPASEDSPWSTNSSRPPSGASAPATPGRPGARRPQDEDDEEKANKSRGRAQASDARAADAEPENPNTALAAALAARHGIEVSGFDSPGVDELTAREFAAAVDDMLAAYPAIDLRAVAIDALDDGEVTRTTWGVEPGTIRPTVHTARIVLALAAAAAANTLAEAVTEAVDAGYLARGVETRPVYYAVVREFGHALDIAGSFRARAAAQRSLIAEYFSTVAPDPGVVRLAAVVDGYRLWRAQVPGACFDGPRLDPAMALADAFTEIQLRGSDAGQPAKALHRLLVEAARVPVIG